MWGMRLISLWVFVLIISYRSDAHAKKLKGWISTRNLNLRLQTGTKDLHLSTQRTYRRRLRATRQKHHRSKLNLNFSLIHVEIGSQIHTLRAMLNSL